MQLSDKVQNLIKHSSGLGNMPTLLAEIALGTQALADYGYGALQIIDRLNILAERCVCAAAHLIGNYCKATTHFSARRLTAALRARRLACSATA